MIDAEQIETFDMDGEQIRQLGELWEKVKADEVGTLEPSPFAMCWTCGALMRLAQRENGVAQAQLARRETTDYPNTTRPLSGPENEDEQ